MNMTRPALEARNEGLRELIDACERWARQDDHIGESHEAAQHRDIANRLRSLSADRGEAVAWIKPEALVGLHAQPAFSHVSHVSHLSAQQSGDRTVPLYATPPSPAESADWYCPQCQRTVPPAEVTYTEHHESCGTSVSDSAAPSGVSDAMRPAIRKVMTENQRLRDALMFYAKHDSWMGVSENAEARTLLVAAGGSATSMDGWSVAEDALAVNVARILAFLDETEAVQPQPGRVEGMVPPEAVVINPEGLMFGFATSGDWAIPTECGARIVDARMAHGWNECRKEMQERIAAAPAASGQEAGQ